MGFVFSALQAMPCFLTIFGVFVRRRPWDDGFPGIA
jgi:hypothetical protein